MKASKGIKGVNEGGKGAAVGVKRTARGRQEGAGWGLFFIVLDVQRRKRKREIEKGKRRGEKKGRFSFQILRSNVGGLLMTEAS
jgi:hypothetical protein